MIVDISAIIAMIRRENVADRLEAAVDAAQGRGISSATYLEAGVVLDRRPDPVVGLKFDDWLETLRFEILPVTATQARTARRAYEVFGRGSGHPAKLNYGDCFAYALAIDRDEPLLFVGDDFGHTDVRVSGY